MLVKQSFYLIYALFEEKYSQVKKRKMNQKTSAGMVSPPPNG